MTTSKIGKTTYCNLVFDRIKCCVVPYLKTEAPGQLPGIMNALLLHYLDFKPFYNSQLHRQKQASLKLTFKLLFISCTVEKLGI